MSEQTPQEPTVEIVPAIDIREGGAGNFGDHVPGEVEERKYDKVNAKGNRYYEEDREGHVIRVFEDGTEYDYTAKRLIRGADQAIQRFKDAPREMQQLGREAIKQDILEGARQAVAIEGGVKLADVAVADVRQSFGQALMERVLDKYAVSGVQAAKLFADMQEWTPGKRGGEELPPGSVRLTATVGIGDLRKTLMGQYREDVTPAEGE